MSGKFYIRLMKNTCMNTANEIISTLSLRDKAAIANLNKKEIETIQAVFEHYIRIHMPELNDDEFDEIMMAIWERLNETHKLRNLL